MENIVGDCLDLLLGFPRYPGEVDCSRSITNLLYSITPNTLAWILWFGGETTNMLFRELWS